MPEQDPKKRAKNFEEVPLGLPPEIAELEAARCIQCKNKPCVPGCPVEIDIPAFIDLIVKKDYIGAARKIKETNALPAVCGRVCPQETQCEKVCTLGVKGEPVNIGALERFVADYERDAGNIKVPPKKPPTGKNVAVVGSGPAGLTCAGDLALMGHEVTIFEVLHKGGGVLVYGIPEFRLPKKIVQAEIDYVKKLGVKVELNFPVGRMKTVDDLLKELGAVFIGSGAGAPNFLGIPDENLQGIYSANEFLTRVNLMKAYKFPEYDTPVSVGRKVAVFGGGNTAMDGARTALRLGPDKVYLLYRRSKVEMPARIEEIQHGEQEGLEFHFLTAPTKFIGNDQGHLTAVECLRMELGEPDASGRRRPVPIKGSEFTLQIDTAIIAIGNAPHPLIPLTTPDLKISQWGNIEVNPETGATSKKGVFAGGDIATGEGTVIAAMGDAKKAARAIDSYLKP